MDFPQQSQDYNKVVISPASPESLATEMSARAVAASAVATWPSSGLAIYVPFSVPAPWPLQVARLEYGVASGNVDVGVFDMDGDRVVSSGSTPAAGTIATFDLTDTRLGTGRYYMAVAADNVTITIRRFFVNAARAVCAMGVLQQAAAFPLPATATFAPNTGTVIPNLALYARTFA